MRLDAITLARLRAVGWPDDAVAHEALEQAPGARLVRVVEQHRSGYVVAAGIGEEFPAQSPASWLRPRFAPDQRAVVGDWVALDGDEDQILALLPRRSLLKRGAAGEHYRQQPIAANIDVVLVVCGLDDDFNPRRIERYLLVVHGSGAKPVVVLTKADRAEDLPAALAALTDISEQGVPVHAVNAKDAASIAVLEGYLGRGRSAVLVGSSGAGKSTLTNSLLGVEKMKTSTVREHDSRGRHTTTHRVLIPLPQGGCLIDTPGMRELKLSGDEDLAAGGFQDIEALAARCRFRDCRHDREPGCAVRAALESGALQPDRYANYCKLGDELNVAADRLAHRLAQRAEARVLGKALSKRLDEKYGKH